MSKSSATPTNKKRNTQQAENKKRSKQSQNSGLSRFLKKRMQHKTQQRVSEQNPAGIFEGDKMEFSEGAQNKKTGPKEKTKSPESILPGIIDNTTGAGVREGREMVQEQKENKTEEKTTGDRDGRGEEKGNAQGQEKVQEVHVQEVHVPENRLPAESPLLKHTSNHDKITGKRPPQGGRGNTKITDSEIIEHLEAGFSQAEVARKFGMNRTSINRRVSRLKTEKMIGAVQGETADGQMFLDTPEQLALLNRMAFDILKDSKTPANTKLMAMKRAEAQNELQLRVQQVLIAAREARAFQEAVIETINEIEALVPGVRDLFLKKLKERREKEKNVLANL